MRIIIDLQGAQSSGSRSRGIGRYSLALSQALVRNKGNHEVIVILNSLFPDTIEPIRADFFNLLPQENIRVWYAPGPVSNQNTDNDWRRKSAELIREAFIANLKPDIVLVSSLIEGLIDDAVTSIGKLSLNVPTAAILYDLIPYIHRDPYLKNPVVESWYEGKLDHLRRTDLLLAISESSRQESIRYLSFPEDSSVNISTAADPNFQPQSIDSGQEIEIRERYNLERPYIMYTGGIDHRKNIEGLIRAYASLPKKLREQHQLAVICSIQPQDQTRLEKLALQHRLKKNELILTGYVPEEDLLTLYNLCKLFVFPSWHEGFGLPALEAMSCGKAVIGSNISSVPEVIGRDDALFDPKCDDSIAEKIAQVLTSDTFRLELEQHGLEQARKFTWDKCAARTITAFEQIHVEIQRLKAITTPPVYRPKMAYLSPLPPTHSGISEYSAELLPELSRHYDIDVIVAQDSVSDPWIKANCQIQSVEWFRFHSKCYERVVYHFGNSPYHQHMFSLLKEIPGVVVLHDFFLSSVVAHLDFLGLSQNKWEKELNQAHGYKALQERYHTSDQADVVWKYPCNLDVLRDASGVIVHSNSSRRLATQWYGATVRDDWAIIPLLRQPDFSSERATSREILNLGADDFIICSFGLLGPTKLNQRLLDSWLTSSLATNKNCILVFVGENQEGEYGEKLLTTIQRSASSGQIRITGWVDTRMFRHYLAAANIAVQLRTLSRGETSAAVLDCMNYGLPTIVNTNGSMADLPDNTVWKLPDNFTDTQLAEAMEVLWQDKSRREQLGKLARENILKQHAPRKCADQYYTAIENFYRASLTSIHALTYKIAQLNPKPANAEALITLSETVAKNIIPSFAQKQLLLDISTLVQHDARTGIQRVVRSILKQLLTSPPEGLRVEPVYATPNQSYRYARRFTMEFLDCPVDAVSDEFIEYRPDDIFLGIDLLHNVVIAQKEFYQQMRQQGVNVKFVVYDLLCILMPQLFDFGEDAAELHSRWLEVIAESDGAVCISKAVSDELDIWVKEHGPERLRPFKISWFHLGADVENSVPSFGMPDDGIKVLNAIGKRPSFLMVGTIEPRKAHVQTLSAFEQLWEKGIDVSLVIVGKQGWMVEDLAEKIHQHSELGKRLFWLEGVSDEYLEKIYASVTCLIAASEGEGFGLPLIEAAQHKKAIIARDIPVFREVAGEFAYYFKNNRHSEILCDAIEKWLTLYKSDKHPKSDDMAWLTWKESTEWLLKVIVEDMKWPKHNK